MQIRFNFQVQVVRDSAVAARHTRRRLRLFTLVALAALALFVPVAFAADTFTDVPGTHPFHDQIERAYAAGMIGACAGSPPPPNQTFCPGNFITKGSAANQYDKAFGLDGTPRPFTPTWRSINIITGGSVAPFTVDSQVEVTNLNADLLDGKDSSDFATRSELATPGTINAGGNPVDWTKLDNVPAGLADGVDATGPTYAAGDGIAITGTEANPVIGVADASVTARKLQTPYTGLVSSTSDVSFRTQFLYATGGTTQAHVVVGVNGAGEGGSGTATVVYNGATIATFALPAGGFRTDTFVSPAFAIGSGGALDVLIRAGNSAAPVIVRNVDVLYS